MTDYEQKIITFLNQATEPIDVEKIRKACGIGNWNTALNNCLKLLIDGKIKGQKTSKSWVFWTYQQTHLHPWDEAIGHLEALQVNKHNVVLTLSHARRNLTITFPKKSPEAETIIQTLTNTPKGTKIAILKTHIPQKPIIVRTFDETTVAVKNCYKIIASKTLKTLK